MCAEPRTVGNDRGVATWAESRCELVAVRRRQRHVAVGLQPDTPLARCKTPQLPLRRRLGTPEQAGQFLAYCRRVAVRLVDHGRPHAAAEPYRDRRHPEIPRQHDVVGP
jgi:hypothetical protein